MGKRPSFQFYPADWRTEAGLRLCSLAARGLWIEMLTIMHDGVPYGHLTIDGEPILPDMLARLIGEAPAVVKRLQKELEARKVFSRTEGGVIFSRRMVRDEDARERRAAGGAAGAEHGRKGGSHGHKGGRPRKKLTPLIDESEGGKKPPSDEQKTPLEGKQKPPPSSSSSSSSPLPNGNGAGTGHPERGSSSGSDPDKAFWDDAKAYLGPRKAAQVGKWVRDHGRDEVAKAVTAAKAEGGGAGAIDPPAFIEACLRNAKLRTEQAQAQQAAADASFDARHPQIQRSEQEWRALLGDEEFARRKAVQPA